MNTQLATEELLTLAAVARQNPATKNVCPRTVTRWAQHGVRGVKLESLRVGDRLMTSSAALTRFLHALNTSQVNTSAAEPRSPSERQRASEQAEAELIRAGA